MRKKIDWSNVFIFGFFLVGLLVIIGYFIKPHLPKHVNKEDLYIAYHQSISVTHFYSYIDFGGLGLYDPDKIAAGWAWNENGITYIYALGDEEFESNEYVEQFLRSDENPDEWKNIDTIYAMLAGNDFQIKEYYIFGDNDYIVPQISEKAKKYTYDKKLSKIEKKRGYTKEDIDQAMEVIIYGGCNVSANSKYKNILEIPMDLQNTCFAAINESGLSEHRLEHNLSKLIHQIKDSKQS